MTWKEIALWCIAATWASLVVWPAEYWYNPGVLRIDDTETGNDFVLFYDGGARRDFLGSYTVVIRNTDTQEIVAEAGSGRFKYDVTSVRPVPLTVSWWAPQDPRMQALPYGHYIMTTCWGVHERFWGLVPTKTTCAKSNIFEVGQL